MEKKVKVLIADDIESIANENKKIIEQNVNIEILGIASDGQEELDMILNLKPDLVITDNQMPKMNGVEVIEKINNLNIENKPDFILYTGDCSSELNNKCINLGVYMILNKLTEKKHFLDIINDYVERAIYKSNKVDSTKNTRLGIFEKIRILLKKEA